MKKMMLVFFISMPLLVSGQKLSIDGIKPKASFLPENALYILDGKVISYKDIVRDSENHVISVKSIAPKKIITVQVLKDRSATEKYGDAGKNGVIIFTTKKYEKKHSKS